MRFLAFLNRSLLWRHCHWRGNTSGSIGDCGDLPPMILAFFIHKTTPIRALPKFLIETSHITGTIMLLLAGVGHLVLRPGVY